MLIEGCDIDRQTVKLSRAARHHYQIIALHTRQHKQQYKYITVTVWGII